MATKKKNNLGKIALLGGGAFLALKALGNDSPAASSSGLQSFAAPAGSGITADELLSLINSNPALRAALKGAKGEAGEAGENGTPGADGLSGDRVLNYGESLLKNGALELNTLEGWSSGTLVAGLNNLPSSIEVENTATFSNKVWANIAKLYKVEYWIKTVGNTTDFAGGVGLDLFTFDDTPLNVSDRVYPVGEDGGSWIEADSTGGFTFRRLFFGGYGSNAFNFKNGAVKMSPVIYKNEGTAIQVNALVLKEVSLSEPVPYNLPFIPKGQIVYDGVSVRVGRYNGVTIDWFM